VEQTVETTAQLAQLLPFVTRETAALMAVAVVLARGFMVALPHRVEVQAAGALFVLFGPATLDRSPQQTQATCNELLY
jgi:hypothetical protein